jgi:hypothetical protein
MLSKCEMLSCVCERETPGADAERGQLLCFLLPSPLDAAHRPSPCWTEITGRTRSIEDTVFASDATTCACSCRMNTLAGESDVHGVCGDADEDEDADEHDEEDDDGGSDGYAAAGGISIAFMRPAKRSGLGWRGAAGCGVSTPEGVSASARSVTPKSRSRSRRNVA